MSARRVAFFTDSFHEVNGVALTSREFVRFARRRALPIFSVHAGPRTTVFQEGSVTTFEFHRGLVKWNLEHDLAIDLVFLRYRHKAPQRPGGVQTGPDPHHGAKRLGDPGRDSGLPTRSTVGGILAHQPA